MSRGLSQGRKKKLKKSKEGKHFEKQRSAPFVRGGKKT